MRSGISTPIKPFLYAGFTGLSTARSDVSMENAEAQPIVAMDNMWCSPKGYLANEAGMTRFHAAENGCISHVRQVAVNSDLTVYSVRQAGGTSLRMVGALARSENIWPKDAVVSSTVFAGVPIIAGGSGAPVYFDGHSFREITSADVKGGKYLCVSQNRLIVAGFDEPGRENEIAISRVNDPTRFASDEDVAEASVLKGVRLNIGSMVDENEVICGIAPFDSSRLAIFTTDRVLVYKTDPDYTQWGLDTSGTVRIGALSHNSIMATEREILFCSRYGVHSMRRSVMNGVGLFTLPLSDEVTELYQELAAKVPNQADISAYYSQAEARLHVFFPVNNLMSYRLSAALTPPTNEQSATAARWALSSHAGQTCGHSLAGRAVVGTIAGMFTVDRWAAVGGARGVGTAELPILWHRDILGPKKSHAFVLYASGAGRVTVECFDEAMRNLGPSLLFDLPASGQANYYGVPLQSQFLRPFQHSYSGIRVRLKVESDHGVRIFAVGILVKKEED